MAASSSKCTPEEMEKALADLHDIYERIPDECKFYHTEAEAWAKKMKEREEKEKKKLCVMPQDRLQFILNYKCRHIDEHKALAALEEEDKEQYKDLRTLFTICDMFTRQHHDFMMSYQEKVRHEYETKGYATWEVADHDEEEEEVVAHQRFRGVEEEEEVVAHQRFRGGGGRRRHRPGVTKSGRGGVVKRLN